MVSRKGERFSDELNKGAASVGKYFFNAGHSGSEAYTYFQKIPVLVNRYPQVRCVIWLPNRNDLISRREFKRRLDEKEAAKGLTSKESMPLQDLLFFGIYKRLGQRFTFEGNIQKEKALNSPHNMYYTQGLVEPLDSETLSDLEVTIKEAKVLLDSKNIHFSAVFLPTRHFNHYYTWNEAKSFQQLVGELNRVGLNSFQFFDLIKGHDYYVDFVHFSPEGHRALANMLEERLNELCPEE